MKVRSARVTDLEYSDYHPGGRHPFVAIFTPRKEYRGAVLLSNYQELHVFFANGKRGYNIIIEHRARNTRDRDTVFNTVGSAILASIDSTTWRFKKELQDDRRSKWVWDAPSFGPTTFLCSMSNRIALALASYRLSGRKNDIMNSLLRRALLPEDVKQYDIVFHYISKSHKISYRSPERRNKPDSTEAGEDDDQPGSGRVSPPWSTAEPSTSARRMAAEVDILASLQAMRQRMSSMTDLLEGCRVPVNDLPKCEPIVRGINSKPSAPLQPGSNPQTSADNLPRNGGSHLHGFTSNKVLNMPSQPASLHSTNGWATDVVGENAPKAAFNRSPFASRSEEGNLPQVSNRFARVIQSSSSSRLNIRGPLRISPDNSSQRLSHQVAREISHSGMDYANETICCPNEENSPERSNLTNDSIVSPASEVHTQPTGAVHDGQRLRGEPSGASSNPLAASFVPVRPENDSLLSRNVLYPQTEIEEVETLLKSLTIDILVSPETNQYAISPLSNREGSIASAVSLSGWSTPTTTSDTSTESRAIVGLADKYQGTHLIGAKGEFKVYYALKEFLKPNFDRDNWRSAYNDRRPPDSIGKADFTYTDSTGELTRRLLGEEIFKKWAGRFPVYHLEVKSTNDSYRKSFGMDVNQLKQARQMTFYGTGHIPPQVYVLFRVSDLNGAPACEAIIDPHWHIKSDLLLPDKVWLVPQW